MATPSSPQPWMEFCERHGIAAAQDFAKSCVQFMTFNMSDHSRDSISCQDFLTKFCETFSKHFESEFSRRQITNGSTIRASSTNIVQQPSNTSDGGGQRHLLRRLSFRMLKKSKSLFHNKQPNDGDAIEGMRIKLSKIIVECRKEGIVNYTTPDSLDQNIPPKWEKCRLTLVKAVGGYMLEFYSPPKSYKPKNGVFCALITDARETTALEMPDHENTFVLKAMNNLEFIIEARDLDDMRSWLATIKYCVRLGVGSSSGVGDAGSTSLSLDHFSGREYNPDVPDLPPRHGFVNGRMVGDRLSSGNIEAAASQFDIGETLRKEFWFHGTLGRSEATSMVLLDGAKSHGLFLVRQSETRTGEFVLTFNFQGRAKHLRMTIGGLGQCRLQHYWFQSIYEMLEHFRQQPIPLESGGNSDVTLTDFVINPNAACTRTVHLQQMQQLHQQQQLLSENAANNGRDDDQQQPSSAECGANEPDNGAESLGRLTGNNDVTSSSITMPPALANPETGTTATNGATACSPES